jgi:acyl-coenzyme A thioesterase PaaI-like protein
MLAVARMVRRARTQFLAEAELFDHAGKLVARGSGSFMRSQIALTAEVGCR